ncbi:PP1R7 [Enterospora canceri]|uniref:PP1R7 n=1 Tax=Enterospora canceri TaxID=1081671 RepID=A0A1Y1S884_9MICR|nr:PP1R7 [Enterospora canceri]
MDKYDDEEQFNHNNMRDSPIMIGKEYKAISLRRNQLKEIPKDVCDTVEYLDVSDNLIGNVDVSRFSGIDVLDLGYNLLKHFDSITNPTITELYLMANDISVIPPSIKDLHKLKKFDIANNRLKEIENLKDLPESIEELFIGANGLKWFEVDLRSKTKLKLVDLQYNKLTEFDCDLLPDSVETLLLNNNTGLKVVKNIRKFKMLDLSDTQVETRYEK